MSEERNKEIAKIIVEAALSEKVQMKLDDCIICFNLRREIFAFDCGYDRHAKLCETCCLKILTENHPKCPVCRRDVTKYSKIFV